MTMTAAALREKFVPIFGAELKYEISSRGRVRSVKTGRIVKSHIRAGGYLMVVIRYPGKRKLQYVHRLVAEAFIEGASAEKQVNHIDCDKTNNCAENLEYVTGKQNCIHASDNGRSPSHSWSKVNLTGFRGVYKNHNHWAASIRPHSQLISIGNYRSPVDAARAYDTAARLLYGEFAVLNFPDLDPVELRPHIVQRLHDLIAMRDRRFSRRPLPGATP